MKPNASLRRWITGAGICLIVGCALAAESSPESWTRLFNGKDLAGWAPVHDVSFEAKDGNLRLVKGMGWLRTEKQYGDFILEFECRALEEKYDSGFFFRAGLEGQPWPKEGWQLNLRYDALLGLVQGFRPVVPSETARIPVNQWFKVRLEVRGRTAVLDVDGERAWETDKLEARRGYLGIQAENKSFDFRAIRILELDRAPEKGRARS